MHFLNFNKMVLKKKIKAIINLFKSKIEYPENKKIKELFSSFSKCYILGSSPTINKLDLKRIDNGAMVISMGNFYEHSEINIIKPNVHIFAASHPPITEKVLINWWSRCNKILPEETILLVEKRDKEISEKIFTDRKVYYYSYGGEYPVDFTKKIISPKSVTIIALQLAIYCNICKIILLGINHDWQCIKPYKHFYDHNKPSLEYYIKKEKLKISYEEQKQPFPKERLYREYSLYQQYENLKIEANNIGLEVLNGDIYSDFDVFDFENNNLGLI